MTPLTFRPTKNKKTGIGMERDPNAKPYEMNRSRLKPVSKKQRKRTMELKDKLTILFTKQVELYGSPRCEAGFQLQDKKCMGDLCADHIVPRSSHPENVDGFENLQVLCGYHNTTFKGSRSGPSWDFRSQKMREACRLLDQEDVRPCGFGSECQDEGQEPEE
ncbi:MAG: hypothetical protein M0R80_26110 [Proteobacteria bacterium]|jgi:hypothetical protein|nr:hypothetical protein [Pseudomonadota bacterium]